MATSSTTSLNGISTGVDTTALINAIVAQKGAGLTRLKAQRTQNDAKTTALNTLSTELSSLSISMLALQDKFNSRTVTSTDLNNAYVTATGKGVATGNFDVTVHTVASKGRVSATLDANGLATNLAVASPSDSVNSQIFTPGTPAVFAIQGTDGVVKKITMTEGANTLNGLAAAINGSGAGVTASVVNTGKGAKPYQLVLLAKDTGTGTTNGVVSLVDITNQTISVEGAPANNLGILAGTVDDLTTPTAIAGGGLTSATSGANATDATFSLNGIELTRGTNVVKDAADGMTFTLKQGGQTGTTTLTVAPDKGGATTAMQDFITKYNQLVKDYKTASTSTKNADGSINAAPLANDASTRAFMANLRTGLLGASAGMPSSTTYKTLASMGVSSQGDGTLNMNIIAFQTAMENDLTAALNLFKFSGTSTSQNVAVKSGGAQTATGSVDFTITNSGGNLSGTLTQDGVSTGPIQVVDGTLQGTGSFTGLSLTVTGIGSGTLTLARGSGQAASDLISSFTGVSGGIKNALNNITLQDKNLDLQIQTAQSRLNSETANLKKKFAEMEATVGAMRAAAGSLTGA